MSGIGNSTTINYRMQFDQLTQTVGSAEDLIAKLKAENPGVVNTYNAAREQIAKDLEWAKGQGFKDAQGKPLQFNTLQEFHDLCLKGGVQDKDGKPINNGNSFWFVDVKAHLEAFNAASTAYNNVMGPATQALNEAQRQLNTIGVSLTENMDALEQMRKLLESGDIEGAVMLLQTTRAKGLEGQLNTEIMAMQQRNAQIKMLNTRLNAEQEKLSKMDPEKKDEASVKLRAEQQKKVSDLKSEIDGLNSESQINMIRVQGLVSKRNEAFDMLSNLLGKFQKTIDGIVGNMR